MSQLCGWQWWYRRYFSFSFALLSEIRLVLTKRKATTFDSVYLSPITSRLNALITGNLTFDDSDVSLFPYLCGFESQITGILSPWCSVFTSSELLSYEYRQDLRYYYGTGPGVDLPSKMMLPFLNGLLGLLEQGPRINGTYANGSTYEVPSIITAFLNDGQITQLGAATGVWDAESPLNGSYITEGYKYISSHFVSMRGTVAFERLSCQVQVEKRSLKEREEEKACAPRGFITVTKTVTAIQEAGGVTRALPEPSQHASGGGASRKHSSWTPPSSPEWTSLPGPPYGGHSSKTTSALQGTSTSNSTSSTASTRTSPSSTSTGTGATTTAQTYIRILLNDAVYPVPSCQSGPGFSCPLSSYSTLVAQKLSDAGNLYERCNVTAAGSPRGNFKGAGFFTDLGESWLAEVSP